ncbi:endolytic transglycosylase MltG [Patescibacteria group bacterium]
MIRKIGLVFLASLVVVIILFGSMLWDALFIAPGPEAQEIEFVVESGQGLSVISQNLADQNLVSSPWLFQVFTSLTDQDTKIKAGSFTLKEGMSYNLILEVLTAVQTREEVQVTIPEGFNLRQIGGRVREALPEISEDEWKAVIGVKSELKDQLAILENIPEGLDLEGYLFPDTYRFFPEDKAVKVVTVMVQTMESRLEALVDSSEMENLHDTLTLASIIQREVRGEQEMKMVADIFQKRLNIDMALQADSTVNYVTDGDSPSVSYDDLQIDSPYNTYKYPGLPPGPISNPGVAAIEAALHPDANDYYYFLTTPEGEVKYGRTLEEHNFNRQFLR